MTIYKKRKSKLICQNKKKSWKKYVYAPGDLIMVKQTQSTKYGTTVYGGLYIVVTINNNSTVYVQKGVLVDMYNIRQFLLYHQ